MRNPLEAIDCQLSHILSHVVNGGYSIEFLRVIRQEVAATYAALDQEVTRRETGERPVCRQSDGKPSGFGGLLDLIGKPEGGAA